MKSYIKYILTIGLFSVIIAGASAQPLQSAYFLERAPLRHQLNPALIPERGYFTIPGLGNISFNVSSDLNYTTFIYPSDGDNLNTFLSSAVSAEEFDKKIRNMRSTLISACPFSLLDSINGTGSILSIFHCTAIYRFRCPETYSAF